MMSVIGLNQALSVALRGTGILILLHGTSDAISLYNDPLNQATRAERILSILSKMWYILGLGLFAMGFLEFGRAIALISANESIIPFLMQNAHHFQYFIMGCLSLYASLLLTSVTNS